MSKPSFQRATRLKDSLRSSLSELLLREVADPRLKGVGITRIDVSHDLHHATVYYQSIVERDLVDKDKHKQMQLAFSKVTPFLRKRLGKMLYLKRIPELKFVVDSDLDHLNHIHQLLDDVSDETPIESVI